MTFVHSVKTCLRKFADFKGRASRSEFWWFQLFIIIMTVVMMSLDSLLFGYTWDDEITPLYVIWDTLMIVPTAAVFARRLHDVGMSGWFQLPTFLVYTSYLTAFFPELYAIPSMMGITILLGLYGLWLLVKLIKDGDSHTNLYGPNPKSEGLAQAFT